MIIIKIPPRYYDSAGYQEGMLEAFRLFGTELVGIDLVFIVNDSLLGPLDTRIAEKVQSVQDSKMMISTGVWKNTVASGAAVAFTRQILDTPAFTNFWRSVSWYSPVTQILRAITSILLPLPPGICVSPVASGVRWVSMKAGFMSTSWTMGQNASPLAMTYYK